MTRSISRREGMQQFAAMMSLLRPQPRDIRFDDESRPPYAPQEAPADFPQIDSLVMDVKFDGETLYMERIHSDGRITEEDIFTTAPMEVMPDLYEDSAVSSERICCGPDVESGSGA